ncbi:transport permease protein [Persicitalea jodogahamensis]|uniref:Transport permease protein n=2 Tax=Persicitalea jodogahamensis TaxID=402147 RepID=A0A8J3GAM2_9BACT|nr:ABC transporter permease [Persicitalea jodogahamensis]GHB75863.1 transport permease protein [Persicitalea jodogahamensis]
MAYRTTIKAGGSGADYWLDLWRNRQLLWILSKRDISVRYKQTLLGIAWSVVRPLMTMLVMATVFSLVAKLPPDPNIPYPLMILGGLTIWTFFSGAFSQVSNSIVLNSNLVSKVYFPRLLMPLSAVAVGFIDFLISLVLFIGLSFFYNYLPSPNIIFLPFFLVLTFISALGFGLFFSVINVRFRDIAQLIPFIVQVGMYACPIAYSTRLVRDSLPQYYKYYIMNPAVGIIDGFKWCLLGDNSYFDPNSLYSTLIVSIIALFLSVMYFRKQENTFVDYI